MTLCTRLLLATALIVAPAAALAGDELFKPNDLEGLGKKIAAYVEARSTNQGLDKPQEEVAKELEKISKRLKRDPLSLPLEMGRALWTSMAYDRKTGIAKGKVANVDLTAYWDKKAKLTYATWIPAKYDPKRPWPVILCVPDAGEKPSDHLTERWVDAQIREAAILVAVPTPSDAGAWLEGMSQTKETGYSNVAFLYGHLIRTYAVDFDRVYIAGRGRGLDLALAYGACYADRFAGIIGRSGDASGVVAENLRNLPTFFAGAGGKASELADKLKALGYDNCTLMAEGKEPDVWSWMQGHTRTSNPQEVVLYPGSQVPTNRTYWIQISPTDAQGTQYVKAKVERATNTITAEGEGVSKFTVFFNDVLVDLDKPVKVVCNGTPNELTIPRSLPKTLDLIMNSRSDPGKFYVASREFDLPPKPKPK